MSLLDSLSLSLSLSLSTSISLSIYLSEFNLPLIGSFYVTHAARALQSHDLSGEGIKLWITHILFWPHKDMESSPDEGSFQCRGHLRRQHKHERQYTPGKHSFIPTRPIWNDDNQSPDFNALSNLKICIHSCTIIWLNMHNETQK